MIQPAVLRRHHQGKAGHLPKAAVHIYYSIGQIGRVSTVRCGRHEGPVWAVHVTYRDGRIAVIRCRRETVRAVQ